MWVCVAWREESIYNGMPCFAPVIHQFNGFWSFLDLYIVCCRFYSLNPTAQKFTVTYCDMWQSDNTGIAYIPYLSQLWKCTCMNFTTMCIPHSKSFGSMSRKNNRNGNAIYVMDSCARKALHRHAIVVLIARCHCARERWWTLALDIKNVLHTVESVVRNLK